MSDSPDMAAAKRLLDDARQRGFAFDRIVPGPDGPLRGVRHSAEWIDELYVGGFSEGCSATRRRRYSLIVPGGTSVTERVTGDALTVLHTVTFDWAIT